MSRRRGAVEVKKGSPRAEIGTASATAFVFEGSRNRHAAITIHSDGSGSIAIYDSGRFRQLANITCLDRADFKVIVDALTSHLEED